MNTKGSVLFNAPFKVEVTCDIDDVPGMDQFFRENKIPYTLDYKDLDYPLFTYECTLSTATVIYLQIRDIGDYPPIKDPTHIRDL